MFARLMRKVFFAISVVVGIVGASLLWGADTKSEVTYANPNRRGVEFFTNATFTTEEGKEVKFYDDMIKDKIVLVHFMYTDCTDMCSLSTARIAQLYQWLGERMGRDVFFVSMSLDPEHDTPAKLATFKESFGVGKGWTFLTGDRAKVDAIRFKLGETSRKLSEHRSDFVIGNESRGVWRRSSAMGSLTVALQSILELDTQFYTRSPVTADQLQSSLTIDTVYNLKDHPGEGLFLKICASCHTVGEGVRFAPDLQAVTLRRDPAWLREYLSDPSLMRANKNPTAVALDSDFPGVVMPYLALNPNDIEDLLTYFAAADRKLSEGEAAQSAAYGEFEKATGGVQGKIDVFLPEVPGK